MEDNVPDQVKGNAINVERSVKATSNHQAKLLYEEASARLLDVNHWHTFTEPSMSVFQLTDSNGQEIYREAHEMDLFRISVPAPGSSNGEGFDWVRVERIDYQKTGDPTQGISMRVRPVPSPLHPGDGTAHFFKVDATSTFSVSRDELEVKSSIRGRNEVPNTDASSIVDKIRNVVVATGAALAGSNLQWERLAKGLLGNPADA